MKRAFTLMELLVVIAIITVLATLLFPAVNKTKDKAKRTACLNNLRQINLGVRMYADEHSDTLPFINGYALASSYKTLTKSYVGLSGNSSPQGTLFACPADKFYYDTETSPPVQVSQSLFQQASYDYTSYGFNGGNTRTSTITGVTFPGIAGWKSGSIRTPVKTLLVQEYPALLPYSWHQPQRLSAGEYRFNDARNLVSFVDGHLNYIKIYWNTQMSSESWHYDPPVGYDYQWSGD